MSKKTELIFDEEYARHHEQFAKEQYERFYKGQEQSMKELEKARRSDSLEIQISVLEKINDALERKVECLKLD